MSDCLYPGTRPGRTIALASVVLTGTACIIHVRICTLQFFTCVIQDELNDVLDLLES